MPLTPQDLELYRRKREFALSALRTLAPHWDKAQGWIERLSSGQVTPEEIDRVHRALDESVAEAKDEKSRAAFQDASSALRSLRAAENAQREKETGESKDILS